MRLCRFAASPYAWLSGASSGRASTADRASHEPLPGSAYLGGSLRPATHSGQGCRCGGSPRAASGLIPGLNDREARSLHPYSGYATAVTTTSHGSRARKRRSLSPCSSTAVTLPYFRACHRTVQGRPNRVTIVAVVLALEVCGQGNLYRVLGCVTTRGWLVAYFVDPYPSIPLGGNPDDPARVLGAPDGR